MNKFLFAVVVSSLVGCTSVDRTDVTADTTTVVSDTTKVVADSAVTDTTSK